MATTFNHCPNPKCRHRPSGGWFGSAYFKVYECRKCGFHYCYKCGDDRCPNCASKAYREAGKLWPD
jgi:hypothetical protein